MKDLHINRAEMLHRMKMIKDDAQVVIDHIEGNRGMEDPTACADGVYVHLSNIEIAIDLNDSECTTWKEFTHNK